MYIRVISNVKCRGQLGQISGKCTFGYYDTSAFSLRKSENATWCMLAATRFRTQEGSSRLSMVSSVCESINRTRIQTSVKYNILLVYRNQPKCYRTAMICVFLQTVVSTDPLSISYNSGKLNTSAKFHYRAGFALSWVPLIGNS